MEDKLFPGCRHFVSNAVTGGGGGGERGAGGCRLGVAIILAASGMLVVPPPGTTLDGGGMDEVPFTLTPGWLPFIHGTSAMGPTALADPTEDERPATPSV